MEVYLDSASTTKPKEKVIQTIAETMRTTWGNPSSQHKLGKEARKILNNSREVVANFIGATPEEIIFTSGACESNILAIDGFLKYTKEQFTPYVFSTTNIEHKSIHNYLEKYKRWYRLIDVDKTGLVVNSTLENISKYERTFVSIQWANNEIGTIQDMATISELLHSNKAVKNILHTDATQIIPDRKIDVKDIGVDMLSFSGQKLNCPKGIGVLYKSKDVNIEPIIYGSQEFGLRGGTENIPYIKGLATAIENIEYSDSKLRDYFVKQILANIPNTYLVGESLDSPNRLKNNASICFKGLESNTLLSLLDDEGVYASSGSACNSDSIEPSYVLKAIGMKEPDIYSVVRFTFGSDLTKEQADYAINVIINKVKCLEEIKHYGQYFERD